MTGEEDKMDQDAPENPSEDKEKGAKKKKKAKKVDPDAAENPAEEKVPKKKKKGKKPGAKKPLTQEEEEDAEIAQIIKEAEENEKIAKQKAVDDRIAAEAAAKIEAEEAAVAKAKWDLMTPRQRERQISTNTMKDANERVCLQI